MSSFSSSASHTRSLTLSSSSRSDTQAVQPPQGEPEYLPDMVEDMHLGEDIDDISKYEVWNRFLRVPLQIPNLEPELSVGHLKSEPSALSLSLSLSLSVPSLSPHSR
jgi:hypothetical protein